MGCKSKLFFFLNTVSTPDVSAAVEILCRKTSSPNHYDWNTVKRLVRYLKRTADLKLKILACDNSRLVGYMDHDWCENKSDHKSTSGLPVLLWRQPNHLDKPKENASCEVNNETEYVSASNACREHEWIICLLKEFGADEP